MSKKKVKVASIRVEYPDGDEKEMSIEDAKALHKQLSELFGETNVPTVPIIIERDRWPRWYGSGTYLVDTGVGDSLSSGDSPPPQPQVWCCAE